MKRNFTAAFIVLCLCLFILSGDLSAQDLKGHSDLDATVTSFLEKRRGTWTDLNIPESDGRILHELIVKNRYTKALEIGTSTGLSGIHIAWALSKTGGKLITIEIDPERHRKALAHFREAGLSAYIDARLADAHDLAKQLRGPFDFIFCDADKEWYKQYLIDLYPKLVQGGCFVAHNVSLRGWGMGTREFYDYIKAQPTLKTTIDESGGGLSMSIKLR